jgi:hypothetical protein
MENKNREKVTLPLLQILVETDRGTFEFDPNEFAIKRKKLLELTPLPNEKSLFSGQPAVLFFVDDVKIPMTPEELYRFSSLNLEEEEYFKLVETYGMNHYWHDDFYDPITGMAWQPR